MNALGLVSGQGAPRTAWRRLRLALEGLYFLSVCALALATYHCSPLLAGCGRPTDSAVFIYVARCMRCGKLPYVDVFDHKGPLLYLLDSAGLCLSDSILGIWFIEGLLFLGSAFFLFFVVRKVFGVAASRLFLFFYCAHVAMTAQGGNTSESWGACFVSAIGACLVLGVCNARWDRWNGFLAGFSMAALLLLRPNMLMVACVYMACLFTGWWRRRNDRQFPEAVLCVMGGASLLLLPVLFWMWRTHSLSDCFDAYIVFNFKYLLGHSGESGWPRAYTYGSLLIIGISSVVGYSHREKLTDGQRRAWAWGLATCWATWLLIAVKPTYLHYFCICAPLIALVAAGAGKFLFTGRRAARALLLVALACHGFGFLKSIAASNFDIVAIKAVLRRQGLQSIQSLWIPKGRGQSVFCDSRRLKPYVRDGNSVTVLGNRCEIYDALEAKTPWKYPYQLPIAAIDPEIAASVKEEIRIGSSRYLVVEKEHLPAYMELDVYGGVNRFYKPIAETGKLMLYDRR